jgi:hypothetical protein
MLLEAYKARRFGKEGDGNSGPSVLACAGHRVDAARAAALRLAQEIWST